MDLSFKIGFCSRKAALYAVQRWHYSKALPAVDLVTIGVWEYSKFIGCVIFARGACPNLHKPYDLKAEEVVELARVALNKHETSVTRIISLSLKMLKGLCPGLRLVVSFADMNQEHLGIIYQAGNWIYSGIAKSTPYYYYKNKWMHQRLFLALKGADAHMNSINGRTVQVKKVLNKLRYLMPLDKKMRKQVLKIQQPYPKKIGEVIKGKARESSGENE